MMRIISRIDYKNDFVIKGRRYEGFRKVGKVRDVVNAYYNAGAAEFLFYDSVAALFGNAKLLDAIPQISQRIFSPITAGGGVRNLGHADMLFKAGADRIALNTAVFKNPQLIVDIAQKYGAQAITAMVEIRNLEGSWRLFRELGREPIDIAFSDSLKICSDMGIGEVCITAIDHDGLMNGFPLEILELVPESFPLPIVLSGGIATADHINLLKTYEMGWLSGVAIGTAFHHQITRIDEFNDKFIC